MNRALDRLPSLRRRNRRRRALTEAGAVMLGVVLLIWSLLPVYNMLLIALDPEEGEIEFTGNLWPPEPSLEGFIDVVTQEARYLEDFLVRDKQDENSPAIRMRKCRRMRDERRA